MMQAENLKQRQKRAWIDSQADRQINWQNVDEVLQLHFCIRVENVFIVINPLRETQYL